MVMARATAAAIAMAMAVAAMAAAADPYHSASARGTSLGAVNLEPRS